MTLDEAIKHAEEVAGKNEKYAQIWHKQTKNRLVDFCDKAIQEENNCIKCAKEHRQLAEWLKELKQLREQTKWILISEKLPNEFDEVWCSTDSEEIFKATYLGKMNDGTDCFDDNDGMMWEGDIIAWKPLPKPYIYSRK